MHLISNDLACSQSPTKTHLAVPNLVTSVICVGGGGEPNLLVRGVVYAVEALQERVPVEEVETLSTGGTRIADDQVYVVSVTAIKRVQGPGENLAVRRQFKG